ncbi:hypothetical protein RJ639_020404, partial [Escallonia herrerae]
FHLHQPRFNFAWQRIIIEFQATELECGGLVVACTFDHRVADAYSANMFLVSWAEIAQFKLPSQMPSFRRSHVGPRRPGRYHSSIDSTYVPVSALPPPKDHCSGSGYYQPISRIYYVEANQLNQLQSIASSVSGARINNSGVRFKRSKLEALSAFLWKLVAGYQKDMGDNKVCKMGIVVDGRARLSEGDGKAKAKLIAEYFGNVLSIPFGEMRSEVLDGKDMSSVADAVHEFLESALTKEHFLGLIDWVEAHRPEPMLAKIYATGIDEGPAVVVSSGARFPVEKVDFGWGGPIFGSYHFPWGGEAGPTQSPGEMAGLRESYFNSIIVVSEMDAKGDFSVKVSKKEVVAATLPLQEHWLPLSNLDLLLPPLDVGVFFCYKKPAGGHHPTTTFGSMAGILKEALAQALVSYYAFAGEVVENAVGEPELLCNNRGVDFMEAVADVKLRDLNLYNPDESIEGKLVPKKKKGVFSIQATGLKCGGLVVACTFDHRVADAYSANMFLVSWAEIAQFKLPSQMPSFRRSLVGPRRPGRYHSSIDRTYVPVSALPPPKDHCSGSVAGYQKDMGDNKVCKMGIVVDGRARLSEGDGKAKPKLIAEYFGNVLSIPFGEMRSEALDGKELSSVADAVHQFLESALTKEHFLGLIDWVEAHRPEPMLAKIYATGIDEGPAVVVSSGARFPVEKVDFGWGGPIFGSYHFPWGGEAGYVMPMPSPMGNGDWVVYMHMLKGQLEFVERHASHVFRPLTSDYLQF